MLCEAGIKQVKTNRSYGLRTYHRHKRDLVPFIITVMIAKKVSQAHLGLEVLIS